MRFVAILFLSFCWFLSVAQEPSHGWPVVVTAGFHRQSDTSNTQLIRKVPEDYWIGFPFYLSLGSEDFKFTHYEFFRIDSTRYYVREYLKRDLLKRFGDETVDKYKVDTALYPIYDANGDQLRFWVAAEHRLSREGRWTEFENDTAGVFFWRGDYHDNKKVGIWKHMLPLDGDVGRYANTDTVVLEELNYGNGISPVIDNGNGIRNRSLAELKNLLPGNWGNEAGISEGVHRYLKESVKWYIYWRGRTLTISDSYFEFDKSGKFIKAPVSPYYPASKSSRGKWTLQRNGDQTFVNLAFDDGTTWQMELLHYSEHEGLIVNLNEHPHIQK